MFGLLCANVHFKRMECVSPICAWKRCDLTYHTCIYETLRFFGQFGHNSGHFSGHLWPEVGPKSQNWSWQMAWGYSVAKIDLFWCATLGSLRIYHFWVIFWAFWPQFWPLFWALVARSGTKKSKLVLTNDMRLFSGKNRPVLMCHTWQWENWSFLGHFLGILGQNGPEKWP